MAPNDDRRPEDNPFVAFRRFADSQVSSLMNTVFTLPATIANFNNAHIAREQCLFGHADSTQCEKLAGIEKQVASLRSEGRELYRVGDLQAMVKKGEQLMQLDRRAEEVRKDIVENARSRNERVRTTPSLDDVYSRLLSGGNTTNEQRKQTDLVEKVANEKGQQWGWSWDWGLPRPFDADDNAVEDTEVGRDRHCGWRRKREEMMQRLLADEVPHAEDREPKVYQWSFSWPPPAREAQEDTHFDAQKLQAQVQDIIDEIGGTIAREVPRIFGSPWYAPEALEENKDLKKAGVNWRDAFEDLVRVENGAPLMPEDARKSHKNWSYDDWARRFHDPATARNEYAHWIAQQEDTPTTIAEPVNEDPSYEYSHDHEDQHDDPPTIKAKRALSSKDMPETELQAYERMLGLVIAPGVPAGDNEEARTSVLSTLSTTERTIGPDGAVTTKVVLKKRFADGREESTETVHTQRGQEHENERRPKGDSSLLQDPETQSSKRVPLPTEERKPGWFWSS